MGSESDSNVVTEAPASSRTRLRKRYGKPLHCSLTLYRDVFRGTEFGRQDVAVVAPEFAPDYIPAGVDFDFEPGELIDAHAIHRIDAPRDFRHADRVVNPGRTRLIAFRTEEQAKADAEYRRKLKAQEEKRKRRAARAHVATVETKAQIQKRLDAERAGRHFIRRHAREMADCEERLVNGFHCPGGRVAGRSFEPFVEYLGPYMLRSRLGSPSLARAAQVLPKAKNLRVGHDKETVYAVKYKLFALDAPYAEHDKRFARYLAIDLDGVWPSIADCIEDLRQIFPPHLMPNLLVGRRDANGDWEGGHLIWYLSQYDEDGNKRDSSVWLEKEDKRCRKAPIRFYEQVIRGLKKLLLPLGADAGWRNMRKPKAALSPFWSTIVVNDGHFVTLKDFFNVPGFSLEVTESQLTEEATKGRVEAMGAPPETSNRLWKVVGNIIEPLAREALGKREASFVAAALQSPAALTAWFLARVHPRAMIELADELAEDSKKLAYLDTVLQRRCEFAAQYCLRRRRKRTARRGRDRDAFLKVETAATRRQIAGDRSAKQKHARKIYAMAKTIHRLLASGLILTKTALIKEWRVATKSFAYKHWDEAIAMLSGVVEFHNGGYRYIGTVVRPSMTNLTVLPMVVSPSIVGPEVNKTCAQPLDAPPIADPGGPCAEKPSPGSIGRV